MIIDMQFPSCREIENDIGIKALSIVKYVPKYPESYYRNISGAYILIAKNGKYIGESTAAVGLIYRLKQHAYSNRIGEILFGYIYETIKDKKVTRKLESYLISKLRPNLNRTRNKNKMRESIFTIVKGDMLRQWIDICKYYKVSRIDNTTIIIKEAKIVVDE